MGLKAAGRPRHRRAARAGRSRSSRACTTSIRRLLESQGVRLIHGTGAAEGSARDRRSRPRRASRSSRPTSSSSRPAHARGSPTSPPVDGERILTTRQAYPPPEIPDAPRRHRVRRDRRRVHPHVRRARLQGDPRRVAPAGAAAEGRRGRRGARGRVPRARGARCSRVRAPTSIARDGRHRVVSTATTGAWSKGRHVVLAVGSIPNTEDLGLDDAGVEVDERGYVRGQPQLPLERRATSTPPVTSRGSCRCRRSRRCRGARSPST